LDTEYQPSQQVSHITAILRLCFREIWVLHDVKLCPLGEWFLMFWKIILPSPTSSKALQSCRISRTTDPTTRPHITAPQMSHHAKWC